MTHGATFLVPASLNANQLEILKYFRVAKSNIHIIKPGAIVNVGRLFVPQMPWHSISEFGTWWAPGVFGELRKQLCLDSSSLTEAPGKFFYQERIRVGDAS